MSQIVQNVLVAAGLMATAIWSLIGAARGTTARGQLAPWARRLLVFVGLISAAGGLFVLLLSAGLIPL